MCRELIEDAVWWRAKFASALGLGGPAVRNPIQDEGVTASSGEPQPLIGIFAGSALNHRIRALVFLLPKWVFTHPGSKTDLGLRLNHFRSSLNSGHTGDHEETGPNSRLLEKRKFRPPDLCDEAD